MAIIQLRRRSPGGRGTRGKRSDICVWASRKTDGKRERFCVGLRVELSVLKRLRWMDDDCVTIDFDSGSGVWYMRRVDDDSGNCLSQQGKNGEYLTVRFTVDKSQLSVFGIGEDMKGYACDIVDIGVDTVSFKRA